MPPLRTLSLLPLALFCAALGGQEPALKLPAEAEDAVVEPRAEHGEHASYRRRARRRDLLRQIRFGATLQVVMPLRDLKDALDRRTGFGLGVQWSRDHGDWHTSRTRLEWNTYPEGEAVAGVRTYAKDYVLSFDHLFKLNQGSVQTYLVAGLGGSLWDLERSAAGIRETRWTTKLAITAGAGVLIGERVGLEARYVASSTARTFDANTLQMSLGWRF